MQDSRLTVCVTCLKRGTQDHYIFQARSFKSGSRCVRLATPFRTAVSKADQLSKPLSFAISFKRWRRFWMRSARVLSFHFGSCLRFVFMVFVYWIADYHCCCSVPVSTYHCLVSVIRLPYGVAVRSFTAPRRFQRGISIQFFIIESFSNLCKCLSGYSFSTRQRIGISLRWGCILHPS